MILTDKLAGILLGVTPNVYPLRMPESGSYPSVVFQQVSGPQVFSLNGPSGTIYPRVQLRCWGLTYTDAKLLADKVNAAINGFRGLWGGMTIQSCICEDERDGEEVPQNANDVAKYYVDLDYIIWCERGN